MEGGDTEIEVFLVIGTVMSNDIVTADVSTHYSTNAERIDMNGVGD